MLYVGGNWVKEGEAAVHPEDRGYNFGDGVYEVIRLYRGRLYQWNEHITRLYRSARLIRMQLPWSTEELLAIAAELIRRNACEEEDAFLYLQVTRGIAPRAHDIPAAQMEPIITAFIRRKERPHATMRSGIHAATVPDRRWMLCDIKSLNLLGAVLAKEEANEAGADECIMHRDGIITECSAANLFLVKNGELYTHPANQLILHGITRQTVIRLCREQNIMVHETPFDLHVLRDADELFLTASVSEITPIVAVDGHPVGTGQPGPLVQRIQSIFEHNISANTVSLDA